MIPIFDIETLKTKKGLYESYYFRGNHQDENRAFWLKHNLIRFNDSDAIRFDNIFIDFDKTSAAAPKVYTQSRILTQEEVISFSKNDWNNVSLSFDNGGFVNIKTNHLSGRIGNFDWNFELKRSHKPYFHFDHPWFYRGFFPKKKILTADTRVEFIDKNSGYYLGMNGHNWGTEHAFSYAYANSNQFTNESGEPVSAFFDGFSAKIKLGPALSPFLSSAGLIYDGQSFLFNQVITCFKHPVRVFDDRNWSASFKNEPFRLELEVFGQSTSKPKTPWVELIYDHPSRNLSKVANTKFAQGSISLFKHDKKIVSLYSNFFELETLCEHSK